MSLDAIASRWADHMVGCLFDGTLVLLVVMVLWLLLRRRAPAQLGYGLFLLVLVKLALPLAVPTPDVLARFSPSVLAEGAWARLNAAPAVVPVGVYVTEVVPEGGVSIASVLLVVWVLIAGWLLVRFVGRELAARRRLRATSRECDGRLLVAFERLRDLMGVRRRVRLLVADADLGPATAGFLRPFVVVPRGLVARLDPRQMSWVLLHELAHIRRGDVFVTLLQRLVQIAFFFHPAVWFANRVIDEQREFACDEAALVAGRGRGHELGETFLSVVEYSQAQTPAAALAMFDSKTVIRRRLMRMLENRRRTGRLGRVLSACFVGVVALLVIPDTVLEAAPQDKKPSAKHELQRLQARLAELEKTRAALLERLRRLSEGVKRDERVKVDVSGKIDVNIRTTPSQSTVDDAQRARSAYHRAIDSFRRQQMDQSDLSKRLANLEKTLKHGGWDALLEKQKERRRAEDARKRKPRRAPKDSDAGFWIEVNPVFEDGQLRLETRVRWGHRSELDAGRTKPLSNDEIDRMLENVKRVTTDSENGRGLIGTILRDDSLRRETSRIFRAVGDELIRHDVKNGRLLGKKRVKPKKRRLQ